MTLTEQQRQTFFFLQDGSSNSMLSDKISTTPSARPAHEIRKNGFFEHLKIDTSQAPTNFNGFEVLNNDPNTLHSINFNRNGRNTADPVLNADSTVSPAPPVNSYQANPTLQAIEVYVHTLSSDTSKESDVVIALVGRLFHCLHNHRKLRYPVAKLTRFPEAPSRRPVKTISYPLRPSR